MIDWQTHLWAIAYAVIFGVVHSGMAAYRPAAERYIPPRIYRVLFVIASFAVAVPWLRHIIDYFHTGLRLFDLREYLLWHMLVLLMGAIAFFFLYPGTFRFAEITTIKKPTQRFYNMGIMRITRHPQLTGMSLWCLSHFLWAGSSFMLATSIGLIGYHLFAVWHGDRRRLQMFGQSYQELLDQTSILPFKAILEGKQKLILAEFKDRAYLWIIVFIAVVYWLHWIY